MRLPFFLLFCLYFSCAPAAARQKSPVKFGTVKVNDFKTDAYPVDTSFGAVVVADIGDTRIVGNDKGFFSWEFTHFKRVHILSKSAFDVSNVTVSLYSDGDAEEELENLKAYTYNLENGKVVETKLDARKGIFRDKISKNRVLKKFTFPDVKEGSIIEFQYTVKSDFLFNLQPWEFQGSYPRMWSEYSVRIPQFIGYVFLMQGYLAPHIRDKKDGSDYFTVSSSGGVGAASRTSFTSGVTTTRWVMKDVPVLKEESFTSSLDNHISKIEFQLAEYKEPLQYKNVMGSWTQLTQRLREASYFGGDLDKNNGWIGDMIDPIVKSGVDELSIARQIFEYVQKNFTCTSSYGLYANENIRTVGRSKRGTVGELNLLLTAMMRYAKINADPVILSTRSNGYTYSLYPLIDRFNYTIARVTIGDRSYFLDASKPQIGFGYLSPDCYNGHARVINEAATPLEFLADSLCEKKFTSVLIVNNDEKGIIGSVQKTPGYYESLSLRQKIRETGISGYTTELQKGYSAEFKIGEARVDSLEKLDMPVKLEYQFSISETDEDMIYFHPMITETWKENPFKAANRTYPVEMPYTFDEVYILRMDVPKGFEVEELPAQMRMMLNEDDDGLFEYLISNSNGVISMRVRLRVSRSYFMPDEYELLREFFARVVKKQEEQIVFKRK